MTINAGIDKRIAQYLLGRLPQGTGELPTKPLRIPVYQIIDVVEGARPQDVLEQLRILYVGGWWFTTEGKPVTEESSITIYSVLEPTEGWTLQELRDALAKPPLLFERERPSHTLEYGPRQEKW